MKLRKLSFGSWSCSSVCYLSVFLFCFLGLLVPLPESFFPENYYWDFFYTLIVRSSDSLNRFFWIFRPFILSLIMECRLNTFLSFFKESTDFEIFA